MVKEFDMACVLGIMLGILGIICAVWGNAGLGAVIWSIGVFEILVVYYVYVDSAPGSSPTQNQQIPPAPPGMTAFCPHCGAQVASGAVMCPRCGRSI